uniref:Zinc knuckle CX2CX4HX4C n=1 Tax=Tanacetum cinerariifolium TaxID=118510 RepID=A0A6L2K1K0_TANCI|nr:hypothetical protein [Tanacetum cinerariifolium]
MDILLEPTSNELLVGNRVWGFIERGFLDNSDKKKKEGGSKVNEGSIPILGDLARCVKNVKGKPTMPKGILKKAIHNVSDDTHEVVIPLNDVGSVTTDNQEAAKDLNGANQFGAADVAKSSPFVDAQHNNLNRFSFAQALIEISSHSTLKKEVTMAIPEDEGDGYIKEVIRVEYEWKPPDCVDCKILGHGPNLCPKRVTEDIPKAPSKAAKSSIMEENKEAKEKCGFKGGSNAASPSSSTNKNDKGDGCKSSQSHAKPELNTKVSNAFEVLNMVGEDVCDSNVQEPKVSEHIGTSSLNLDKEEVQDEGLWSRFKKVKKNAKSKYSKLEDDLDEYEVYMPHGGGGMDGLEDDLDCYDDYRTQMYDISPQEQAFCDQFDICLNSHGNEYVKSGKIKAKRTKPGTGMKRVQEIKAEGEFISNLIPLIR